MNINFDDYFEMMSNVKLNKDKLLKENEQLLKDNETVKKEAIEKRRAEAAAVTQAVAKNKRTEELEELSKEELIKVIHKLEEQQTQSKTKGKRTKTETILNPFKAWNCNSYTYTKAERGSGSNGEFIPCRREVKFSSGFCSFCRKKFIEYKGFPKHGLNKIKGAYSNPYNKKEYEHYPHHEGEIINEVTNPIIKELYFVLPNYPLKYYPKEGEEQNHYFNSTINPSFTLEKLEALEKINDIKLIQ